LSKKWDDAKAYCEGNGDRLAVFDSLESISWARHMRKTHSGSNYKKIYLLLTKDFKFTVFT